VIYILHLAPIMAGRLGSYSLAVYFLASETLVLNL